MQSVEVTLPAMTIITQLQQAGFTPNPEFHFNFQNYSSVQY